MTDAPTPSSPGKPGLAVSPLAVAFPAMGEIAGVEIATGCAGFYKHDRPDLVLFRFAEGTACAGVFTQNKVGSAPVDWCKAALAQTRGEARALIVNAGCANAFTGEAGAQAAQAGRGRGERGARLPFGRGDDGLHRRDRRGAGVRQGAEPAAGADRLARSRQVGRGGPRHHDHRHLPERRSGRSRDRRREGPHRRDRQGLGHDRAGHGHDAGLRGHRRQPDAGRPARPAGPWDRRDLQRGDGGRRHLHQRHPAAVRHRPLRRAAGERPARHPAAGLPPGAGLGAAGPGPGPGARRGGGRASSSR